MAFVGDIERPELSSEDRHHLSRVLRVRDGAPMVVCDGAGAWRHALFGDDIENVGETMLVAAPEPRVGVAFALTKGDRPELAIQKLTEIGVDRITPISADHCVVRWDEAKAERNHARMQRIAHEASMQCRRTHLPIIESLRTFAEVASGAVGDRVLLADVGGQPLSAATGGLLGSTEVTVVVGPEGGWSTVERKSGLESVSLGIHVLRAETAAISAGVLLVHGRENSRAD